MGEEMTEERLVNHHTAIFDGETEFPDEEYHVRAHVVTRPGDVLQLDGSHRSAAQWAMAHFNRVGLQVTDQIHWGMGYDVAREFPGHTFDPFIFDHRAHAVRPDQRWFNIVEEMNDKNATLRRARRLGVPYPDTEIFGCKSKVGDLERFQYPLFLKRAVSLAGQGVWYCPSSGVLEARLQELPEGIGVQLQQPAQGMFLNVSYFCEGDGTYRRILCSEQILEGPCHVGNRPTRRHRPWSLTDPLAEYMTRAGMRGYFAFDVVATPTEGYLLIECNPRWNGSCYPTEVASRVGINGFTWASRNFCTELPIEDIDLGGLEFNSVTRKGIIVLNYGTVKLYRKIGLMLIGTPNDINNYEAALPGILGVHK